MITNPNLKTGMTLFRNMNRYNSHSIDKLKQSTSVEYVMSLEEKLAAHNSDYFLREFTYTATRFRSQSGQELELCDGAIWIDDLLILFQLKERNFDYDSDTADTEVKWFEKKVSKRGVDQLVATIKYLQSESTLPLSNRRGQTIDLTKAHQMQPFKIVLYSSSNSLPLTKRFQKGRVSDRIGFVHFMHIDDYISMCSTLCTPLEIADYLTFREKVSTQYRVANDVWEKALLGKYLSDTDPSTLCSDDETYVDALLDDRDDFSIERLLYNYLDRVSWGNDGTPTQYHLILAELAKLRRNALKIFRHRLQWAIDTCRGDIRLKPSRFFDTKTNCGFIFIPLPKNEIENWRKWIEYYTLLSKYDYGAEKSIGITVTADPQSSEHFLVNWLYAAEPWREDAEFELHLMENPIFRTSSPQNLSRYQFKSSNSGEN